MVSMVERALRSGEGEGEGEVRRAECAEMALSGYVGS